MGARAQKEGFFSFSMDYSYLNAKRNDGSWLPFSPANRFIFNGRYYIPVKIQKVRNFSLSLGADHCQKQNHIDTNEQLTPGYWLFNTSARLTLNSVSFQLICTNLTNTVYFDHLSRLKYYGLNDMGRNIVLNFSWQF
jgi:iron complex outermembrane receptor protein